MDLFCLGKRNLLLGIVCFSCLDLSANASQLRKPTRIGEYLVPAAFSQALQQGMRVPVFIRYKNGDEQRSQQKIADAVIAIADNTFVIRDVSLTEMTNGTVLSSDVQALLQALENQQLGQEMTLMLSDAAHITFDVKSFYLELTVDASAIATATLPRSFVLAPSSVTGLTNVLNYNVGSYYNQYSGGSNSSSYISLDNTSSWREHHVNLNGSLYGLGTANRTGKMYRAMYERDVDGNRLAAGMVDTWNLQSIASMSALNSSRIYGLSYGNKSNTQIENKALSLTPITVFLPAAGEVHVLRDDKLLSIQNFTMGSHEIDTSTLPFGIYNVDVQIVVNGRVINRRNAQINKVFASGTRLAGEGAWQLFGGMLQFSQIDYRYNHNINHGEKETWLLGAAGGITLPYLSGVSLKSTVYGFDRNGVNESDVSVLVNESVNVNQQTLVGTDGSWKSISTMSLALPDAYGSLWGSREFSDVGKKLPMRKGDYLTYGTTLNLGRLTPALGVFSVSRTEDRYASSKYTNADYSQTLFSGQYGTLGVRAGVQRYHYRHQENGVTDKYINLDFSMPLGNWFSVGMSNENGSTMANATARKRFDNSPITQAGLSVSKRLKTNDKNGIDGDRYALNGFASYDTKYSQGAVSVTRSSNHDVNANLNAQGSLAVAKDGAVFSNGTHSSGILVNTDFNDEGTMTARINGQHYSLRGKRNFIALPPYAQYDVEFMNDKNSLDSVNIVRGRKSQVVLYPGNVSTINPEVRQLVTVFGRIKQADGQAAANLAIHNHIGKTKTDAQGEFALDVDKRYPTITLVAQNGGRSEVDLNLQKARGAIWVGDLLCEHQTQMAQQKGGEHAAVY